MNNLLVIISLTSIHCFEIYTYTFPFLQYVNTSDLRVNTINTVLLAGRMSDPKKIHAYFFAKIVNLLLETPLEVNR